MPTHDKEATPPELRRAALGSRVGRQTVHHTAQSMEDFVFLHNHWRCNESEVVRKALEKQAKAERRRLKRAQAGQPQQEEDNDDAD